MNYFDSDRKSLTNLLKRKAVLECI